MTAIVLNVLSDGRLKEVRRMSSPNSASIVNIVMTKERKADWVNISTYHRIFSNKGRSDSSKFFISSSVTGLFSMSSPLNLVK